MARSQRSGNQKHLIGKIEPASPGRDGEERWSVKSLCGDKYAVAYSQTPDRERIERVYCDTGSYSQFTKFDWSHDVCGACQSKHLAAKLKAEPIGYVLGDRIDMSQKPMPFGISSYTWKSVYPVIDTNVLADADDPDRIVAFVCIENGWGKAWQIQGWGSRARYSDFDSGKLPPLVMESDPVLPFTRRYEISGEKRESKATANRLASKELALTMIPSMIQDGHVPLRANLIAKGQADFNDHIAAKAQRVIDDEARRIAREKQLREMAADKGHVEDVLRQITNDETLLSNYQRQGIFMAAKLLGIDLLTRPVQIDDNASTMETSDDDFSY